MTDNEEIIKALEECIELRFDDTEYATVRLDTLTNALDLINCQKAENKRLEKEVNLVSIQFQDLQERYEEARAEIERLENENTVFGEIIKKEDDEISTLRKDLLKRQNLEESYSKSVKQFDKRLEKTVKLERAEAVKECLAKVKNYIKTHCNPYGKPDFDYDTSLKILNFIDKLAKEMAGDDNA